MSLVLLGGYIAQISMANKEYEKHLTQAAEYKSFRKIRLFGLVAVGIMVLVIAGSVWFIYNNIYKTLDRVHEILVFQSDPFFEPIDFNRYERVEERWQVKYAVEKVDLQRDPFKSIPVPVVEESSLGGSDLVGENVEE